jgi:autotransporter-associated beta strand protein
LELECLEGRIAPTVSVLTYHNDNARTGLNSQETILNPSDVNVATFGKLFTLSVDGKVDATPLYLPAVAIPSQGTHNVLYVATEHDSLYAFDADNGAILWHDGPSGTPTTILPPGEVPSDPVHGSQVTPEIGITSTPVIDPATGRLYLVAMSKLVNGSTTTYFQRIHAIDVTTGLDVVPPVVIQASYPGTGDNSSGGNVIFDPMQYKERDALLLLNGVVYTSWASHSDVRPYTGWVIGYNASNLQQVSVLNTTPNGSGGAYWNAGAGPAADVQGNFYNLAGNGTFDTTLNNGFPNQGDFGNAFIKFSPTGGLHVADYFTMHNTVDESNADTDLGSGGVIVLPDMTDSLGHTQHLAIGAGKDGNIYLVNRDNMGKFNPNNDNAIYQELDGVLSGGEWATSAYFNNAVYFGPVGNHLLQFTFTNALLNATPASQSATTFGYPGTTPSISSNGNSAGIVWDAENGSTAVLHAYDATNLADELYNSNQAANNRDHFGTGNKFITPMIANGKVYVGTTNGVGVFGLIAAPAAPTNLKATASGGQITLTWTGSPGAVSYNVYRGTSPQGESATPLNANPITTTTFVDASVAAGTTYYYIVKAVNPVGLSPASNEANATVSGSSTTDTWTGKGPDSKWSDAQNWSGGVVPKAGDSLVFAAGANQLTNTNDLAAGTAFGSVTFSAAGFVIGGNAVTLSGGTDGSKATGNNTFNLSAALASAQTFKIGPAGTTLTFGGNITLGGFVLTVNGGAGTGSFSGVLSGTGALTSSASGTLAILGNNSYSGGTTQTQGVLALGNNNALGTGTLSTRFGTLSATGGPITIANAVVTNGTDTTFAGNQNLTFTGSWTIAYRRRFVVTNTGLTTIAGPIKQSASGDTFTKDGAGTLVLAGAVTITNATIVNAGTLVVTGSIAASSAITVKNGGTLAGSGTVGSVTVNAGGTILPGTNAATTGILTTGAITFASGANFNTTLNGNAAGTGYDQLVANGAINLGGSTLHVTLGFVPAVGTSFTIIKNNGSSAVTGTFNALPEGATFTVGTETFQITYKGGAGQKDVVITRTA